jgi:post-segregation antitoxin (ccd killing protein)
MPCKSSSFSLDAHLINGAKNAGVNLSCAAEAGIENGVKKDQGRLLR